MASYSDLFKESLRPFGSPSNLSADERLQRRLGRLGSKSTGADRIRSQVSSLGEDRARFGQLAQRFATSANAIGGKLRAVGRTAASEAGQDPRTATTAGDTLSEALRRAKARQGIVQRGDQAVRQQRLKDRLQLVRSDVGRRSSALDLQTQGQQIAAGVNLSGQNARDAISGTRADALGGAMGSFAAVLKGNKDNTGSLFDFGKKNAQKAPAGFVGP
jgi:hypothetical protein